MLKSFCVNNFKSLINLVFEPAGLNLLVGPNNAGKTNLCHALRFLSLTAVLPLDEAAAKCTTEPWNLLNVYMPGNSLEMMTTCELVLDGDPLTFTYLLTVVPQKKITPAAQGPTFTVARETLRVTGSKFADTVLLENAAGQVKLLHEKRFLRGLTSGTEPVYVDTIAPNDTTMLYRLYDLETNQRSNLFKKYLSSWGYYNFDPNRLRSKLARRGHITLDSDGSNLLSILFTIHNVRPRLERKILEASRLLEPRLDLFSFETPDPDHVYLFFEDTSGHRVGVDSMSDGTLRYLAMSYLVLNAREEAGQSGVAPLLVIAEPENGLFVGYLRELFEKINPSGAEGQFLFTSHNPYFIDLFDAALEGLFVVRPGEAFSSLVRPDRGKLAERLGKFSLGEMHFRGLLE